MTKTLDISKKQDVKYCIPLWLRDEQIKIAISKVKGRIEPMYEKRTEPIALVAFAPSLRQTWRSVKKFKYIMTCSGSHRFLIDKGIIPTWHVEVDPRAHKIDLLGEPHPDVIYLPASACHPKYFDHLIRHNAQIKLWHVFDSYEEGMRVLPHGEWALTGGASVGLRMMSIARFFGFTDFHIFGMDGNVSHKGSHTSFHPNSPKDIYQTTYEGKTYLTTPSILECARQTFHELDQLKDVTARFYGKGLVQDMAKKYVKNSPAFDLAIGISKPELISEEYKEQNKILHRENLAYGVGGKVHAPVILQLYEKIKAKSLLDYGCGKGYLAKNLPFPIWEYDPAIEGKDESPKPADLVVCLDVLEHIEPDYLDLVLADISRCTLGCGYFVINTRPAGKTLPDGRNTHLIQKGKEFWRQKLEEFFELSPKSIIEKGGDLHCVVAPKVKKINNLKKIKAA
jgi:hypothetical protein